MNIFSFITSIFFILLPFTVFILSIVVYLNLKKKRKEQYDKLSPESEGDIIYVEHHGEKMPIRVGEKEMFDNMTILQKNKMVSDFRNRLKKSMISFDGTGYRFTKKYKF